MWTFMISIMFSRFIHVVACIVLHSLLLTNNVPLHRHTAFHSSIQKSMEKKKKVNGFLSFPHLFLIRIALLWTWAYTVLHGHVFSFLLGVLGSHLGGESLGLAVTLRFTIWETTTVCPVCLDPSKVHRFIFPLAYFPPCLFLPSLIIAMLVGMK